MHNGSMDTTNVTDHVDKTVCNSGVFPFIRWHKINIFHKFVLVNIHSKLVNMLTFLWKIVETKIVSKLANWKPRIFSLNLMFIEFKIGNGGLRIF